MALVSHASCFSTTTSVTLSPEFLCSSRLSFFRLSSLQLSAPFPSPKGFCGCENECLTRRRRTRRRRSGVSVSSSSRRKAGKAEPKTSKAGIYLDAIVKVYNTHIEPNYSLPWQKQRQRTSSGSAFAIGDKKLLTNAHCVEHGTQLKVKKRGDDQKYIAKVLAMGVDCNLALLSVENKEFWNGVEPLVFGKLPQLKDLVAVMGYPSGGETISVTKGVISQIEVTYYTHGPTRLLTIQIDADINPGNSGGPALNSRGQCIGVAFKDSRLEDTDTENIGYLIPTTVVSHFLKDYERHGNYTGFPWLGVLLQWKENLALRSYLNLSPTGMLVRRVAPTSNLYGILKEGDVIASFNGILIEWDASVPFRSSERIEFGYLISQKFSGDVVELGVIRDGAFMIVQSTLGPRVHLVPPHIEIQPSYLIVLGFVFTPLSVPLIHEEDDIGLKLKVKEHYSLARFKGEQIVILSQVLANEWNVGYEDMSNQQVLKFNRTKIKNIRHLAHLVDTCEDKYLVFEFEDRFLAVLERESAMSASSSILKDYGIPSERSADLLEPYVDILCENNAPEMDVGDSPVLNTDALFWA